MKGVIKGMGKSQTYWIDGQQVSRARFKKAFPDRPIGTGDGLMGWKKQWRSDSLGCNIEDIPAWMEIYRKAGITGVSYDHQTGELLADDRGARRDVMKLRGRHDRQGGYGDDHATTDFVNLDDDKSDAVYSDDFQ